MLSYLRLLLMIVQDQFQMIVDVHLQINMTSQLYVQPTISATETHDRDIEKPMYSVQGAHKYTRNIQGLFQDFQAAFSSVFNWGTGIRGLMRGMANLPKVTRKLLVVKDKVGRPQVSLG